MELAGRPTCDYIFETISQVDTIDEKYVYCSDEAIKPYIAPYEDKGLRFPFVSEKPESIKNALDKVDPIWRPVLSLYSERSLSWDKEWIYKTGMALSENMTQPFQQWCYNLC